MEIRSSYKILVDKLQEEEPLGTDMLTEKHNIQIHNTEIAGFNGSPFETSSEHDSETSGFTDAVNFVTIRRFRFPPSCS